MEKAKNKKLEREFVFSKEVDSTITGFALGLGFLGTGVFLLFQPEYFGLPIITYIVGAVLCMLGVLFTGLQLSKTAYFKGGGYLAWGIVCVAIWLVPYLLIKQLWSNIVFFIFLFIGAFAVFSGIFQSVYSIVLHVKSNIKRDKEEKKEENAKIVLQVILFLTQLCALSVAILNVIKAVTTQQ